MEEAYAELHGAGRAGGLRGVPVLHGLSLAVQVPPSEVLRGRRRRPALSRAGRWRAATLHLRTDLTHHPVPDAGQCVQGADGQVVARLDALEDRAPPPAQSPDLMPVFGAIPHVLLRLRERAVEGAQDLRVGSLFVSLPLAAARSCWLGGRRLVDRFSCFARLNDDGVPVPDAGLLQGGGRPAVPDRRRRHSDLDDLPLGLYFGFPGDEGPELGEGGLRRHLGQDRRAAAVS
mmetsp:Transcript_96568/g.278775  ORF Transcript_96568/g.278775 Transcript_96568/m.278775 type:complete len:232 (-) Transcript_96568:58-753(-)